MKTTFSTGVIVTSEWLNGAKDIKFDGQDMDWHYNPLGLESLVKGGPNGLDSRYVTLGTNQPNLSSSGVFLTGFPISGDKVVSGKWSFGFNPTENPTVDQNIDNAPLSYLTNEKYKYITGNPSDSVANRFGLMDDSDLVTKVILTDQISEAITIIDNGTY